MSWATEADYQSFMAFIGEKSVREPEKKTFENVSYIYGGLKERTVWRDDTSKRSLELFKYNPTEWDIEVTFTRKVKPFVPGWYRTGSGSVFELKDEHAMSRLFGPWWSARKDIKRVNVTDAE